MDLGGGQHEGIGGGAETKPAGQPSNAHAAQRGPSDIVGDGDGQAVAPRRDLDAPRFEDVAVVADEDEGRAAPERRRAKPDLQTERRIVAQRGGAGDRRGEPLAAAEAGALEVAMAHHARINAERRVADEDSAVDLGDVERRRDTGGERVDGGADLGRDEELLGEMVEGAERDYAERAAGAGEERGRGVDRAIPPADEDEVDAAAKRATQGRLQPGTVDQLDIAGDTVLGEASTDEAGDPVGTKPRQRPRRGVQQDRGLARGRPVTRRRRRRDRSSRPDGRPSSARRGSCAAARRCASRARRA